MLDLGFLAHRYNVNMWYTEMKLLKPAAQGHNLNV